jgi:hypothetical protein
VYELCPNVKIIGVQKRPTDDRRWVLQRLPFSINTTQPPDVSNEPFHGVLIFCKQEMSISHVKGQSQYFENAGPSSRYDRLRCMTALTNVTSALFYNVSMPSAPSHLIAGVSKLSSTLIRNNQGSHKRHRLKEKSLRLHLLLHYRSVPSLSTGLASVGRGREPDLCVEVLIKVVFFYQIRLGFRYFWFPNQWG